MPDCIDPTNLSNFVGRWKCHELQIRLLDSTNGRSADIQEALGEWNSVLGMFAGAVVPRFSYTTSPTIGNIVVIKEDSTAPGAGWCGATNWVIGAPDTVRISKGPVCATFETNTDFGKVVRHELAHVLGYQIQAHNFSGSLGVSETCAVHLSPDGEGNVVFAPVCQHEVEYIYAAYSQRVGEFDQSNFWNRHIVTGINTVGSFDVEQGETLTLAWDALTFAPGQLPSALPGPTEAGWMADLGNIEIVDAMNGVVRGRFVGDDEAVATLSQVPSAYLKSTFLNLPGIRHRVSATVLDSTSSCTPGIPPLRVTSITADQEPAITSVGSHAFTATHVGCPNGPMWHDWTFDPSAPGMPTTTLDSVGANVNYWVAGGNYTITVTALATDSIGGFPLIRYVNVCTDPPGGGLAIREGEGGGGGTNATGGCGGGELP
jgi:hypothetical protein